MDLVLVIVVAPPAGQDGAGDVVPHGEEGGRHGSEWVGCEGGQGQGCAQSGVLHADFEGDGLLLCVAEALRVDLVHQLGEAEAQRVAAQVVQDDHRDGHQGAGHEQLRTVGGNDHADDKQNSHLRNDRQGDRNLLDLLAEDHVADHTEGDREEHHLDGVEEQGLSRHGHVLRSEQLHQQRNHERGAQGGEDADGDIEGHVTTGQVAHHVGGGARRAAADENHAHGQRAGQVEDRAQGHGDERHDDEVSYGADDDHQRLGQDALEVVQRQGQAHAEQHDAQHVAGVRLAPQAGGRHEVVEDGPDDDDDRKPLGQPICKGFNLFHGVSLPLFGVGNIA